jgi:3-oxoacyl-[acyl-carrier-protein] synthase-3
VRTFLRKYRDGLSEEVQERLLRETGILTRHFAIDLKDESRRETNTTLAAEAGRRALDAAGWQPDDVDLLVVTTVVPDQLIPPTSPLVQEALGIARCAELEISANCTAPYKAVSFAASQIALGHCERALVCSAQYTSFLGRPPWTNPEQMHVNHGALRWIVSDGAAALALERGVPGTGLRVWLESSGTKERCGMSLHLGSAFPDFVEAFQRGDHHVSQDDRYVLKAGVSHAIAGLERMFDSLGIAANQIDHFIPAVSSMQLLSGLKRILGERCDVSTDCWRTNFDRVGYLGGAGFIVVLDEMVKAAKVHPGELICAVAEESSKWMFAGLTLRWNP